MITVIDNYLKQEDFEHIRDWAFGDRSQVDKATTITDTIGDKLDVIQTEIDDIWKAYDALAEKPLG